MESQVPVQAVQEQFTDCHTLQEAPRIGLACTHIAFEETSAARIMNELLKFFIVIGVAFSMVSPEKFSMKGEVIETAGGHPLECTFKVRGLRRGNQILTEFRCRKGDSIAFCRFFERVTDYLKTTELRMLPPTNDKGMPITPLRMFVPPPPPPIEEMDDTLPSEL